jgi:hypothetical protein
LRRKPLGLQGAAGASIWAFAGDRVRRPRQGSRSARRLSNGEAYVTLMPRRLLRPFRRASSFRSARAPRCFDYRPLAAVNDRGTYVVEFRTAAAGAATSPNRRRGALDELLASSRDGATEAIMLAHGFTVELMVDLCVAGLALATVDRIVAGGRA